MTNDDALDALAEHLLTFTEHDVDYLLTLEMLNGLLTPFDWAGLCERLVVCPRHICDAQICADDQDDCEIGREAWERQCQQEEGR